MSDLVQSGDLGGAALERVNELELNLQTRLGSLVPEALDGEGRVDWKTVGNLRLARDAGSIVMALAVPDVMSDYVSTIAEAEQQGRIDRAIELLGQSDEARGVAISVLGVATDALFTESGSSERIIRRDGEIVTEGQVLREFADVVTLRLYEAQITTKTQQAFIDATVMPMVELVQAGFNAESALAILDMSVELDHPADDIVVLAQRYQMDLGDEFDRNRLLAATRFAGGVEHVHRFINLSTGEIDPRVFEQEYNGRDEARRGDRDDDEPATRKAADDEEVEQEPSDDWEDEETEPVVTEGEDEEPDEEMAEIIANNLGQDS